MSTETNEVKRNWNETDIPSLTGKTALITGANSGLGYELSRMLAAKGARVLMACRSAERCTAAINKIKNKLTLGQAGLCRFGPDRPQERRQSW